MRSELLSDIDEHIFDVLIIGGGINGATSAACLQAHGYKVCLLEKGDFASGTSQESSNMVWGGIKYLESFEFKLVYELCKSRDLLIEHYPTRIIPIPFYTSLYKHNKYLPFFAYLGSILYWMIALGRTEFPKYMSAKQIGHDFPIITQKKLRGGTTYLDAFLPENDARFTFQLIEKAIESGAYCINYMSVESFKYENETWEVKATDQINPKQFTLKSKILINAAGPHLEEINSENKRPTDHKLILSKGIHLIVPQLTNSHHVLTFMSKDERLFFVLPMGNRSCIGTTDTPVKADTKEVTDEDRKFVLDNINQYLNLDKPLTREDIIAERCGVRTLCADTTSEKEDWIHLSRHHKVECFINSQQINIIGGKLTNCLNVGEEILDKVNQLLQRFPEFLIWYGEESDDIKESFLSFALEKVEARTAHLLWRRYGSKAIKIINLIEYDSRLKETVAENTDYLKAELLYIKQNEYVTKDEDLLRRRTHLSLTSTHEQMEKIKEFLLSL